jgi:hypothetical protein
VSNIEVKDNTPIEERVPQEFKYKLKAERIAC